jgi:putative endopeptidase
MKQKLLIGAVALASFGLATSIVSCADKALKSGVDLTNLNTEVRPGDDFYEYACGGWMKKNPLPAAYSRYGSFDMLAEDNNKRINGILDELLKNDYEKGTTEQKLSDLYKLAMDSARREKDGVEPAMAIIRKMEAANTVDELFAIQLDMARYGDSEFIRVELAADEKNATENILNVGQGGLTLGQKDYYLENDTATVKIREAYKGYVVSLFKLFGFAEDAASQKMANIMKVETALAKVSRSRTELRDPQKNYNKMTLADFAKNYPHIQLEKVMNARGIASQYIQDMVVGQPEFMAGADKVIAALTPAEYRDFMEWGVVNDAAGMLNNAAEMASFEFFGKVMTGRKEDHPLWRRSVRQVESVMGEALGKIYVDKYFPAAAKERMVKLVSNLQEALAERIKAQDWMNDSTKANALDKLSTFYVKVGYPDKWTDMSDLNIDPEKSYYENMMECSRFWNEWNIAHKAGNPVDKDDWYMFPQTVNAYYNPTTNEICFPAGILQVPFFDMEADDAFNYGAIGVVIGHEMTHGFDDQGRQYDKEGNMHDWWTESDGKNFTERTDKYADFFSNIKVLPDLNGNGRLTLGENLADHGGLQVAWYAYKNATKGQPLPESDGFTADQRFFLAYAGVWAGNVTDEEIRNRTKSDPHSLGRWRVNGALPHVDMWYEAFGIKEGDKMFVPKEERLSLW